MPTPSASPKKPRFQWVAVSSLSRDEQYQRDEDKTRAKRYSRAIRDDLLGAILVSERADGSRKVVDGWTRTLACQFAGRPKIYAEIHYGMTFSEEARLFFDRNDALKRANAMDKFKSLLQAEDLVTMQINMTAHKCGYTIGKSGEPGVLSAAASLYNVAGSYGIDALEWTLTALKIWIPELHINGSILTGLGLFYHRYSGQVEMLRLQRRVFKHGPEVYMRRAKAMTAGMSGGNNPSWIAEAIAKEYEGNRKRKAA